MMALNTVCIQLIQTSGCDYSPEPTENSTTTTCRNTAPSPIPSRQHPDLCVCVFPRLFETSQTGLKLEEAGNFRGASTGTHLGCCRAPQAAATRPCTARRTMPHHVTPHHAPPSLHTLPPPPSTSRTSSRDLPRPQARRPHHRRRRRRSNSGSSSRSRSRSRSHTARAKIYEQRGLVCLAQWARAGRTDNLPCRPAVECSARVC